MVFHRRLISGVRRRGGFRELGRQFLFGVPGVQQFTVPFGAARTQAARLAGLGLRGVGRLTRFAALRPRRTLGLVVGVPAAAAVVTSPFGRRIIKGTIDPRETFRRTKEGLEILEDPKGFFDRFKQDPQALAEAIRRAGLVGGVAALGAGALVAGSAVRERIRRARSIGVLPLAPTAVTSRALAPVRQPPVEEPVVVEPMPQPKPITIRNVFKPSVDIRFSKSKKFINQQVLVK